MREWRARNGVNGVMGVMSDGTDWADEWNGMEWNGTKEAKEWKERMEPKGGYVGTDR